MYFIEYCIKCMFFLFLLLARTRYGVCVNFYRRIDQCFINTPKNSDPSEEQCSEKSQRDNQSLFLKW